MSRQFTEQTQEKLSYLIYKRNANLKQYYFHLVDWQKLLWWHSLLTGYGETTSQKLLLFCPALIESNLTISNRATLMLFTINPVISLTVITYYISQWYTSKNTICIILPIAALFDMSKDQNTNALNRILVEWTAALSTQLLF